MGSAGLRSSVSTTRTQWSAYAAVPGSQTISSSTPRRVTSARGTGVAMRRTSTGPVAATSITVTDLTCDSSEKEKASGEPL